MKKYKDADGAYLRVELDNRRYVLQWVFPYDAGGMLGDCEYDGSDSPCEEAGRKACLAFVTELMRRDVAGLIPYFWFDRLSDARTALALTNAAMIAAQEDKVWPEWAMTAVANGWKPPKGWNP